MIKTKWRKYFMSVAELTAKQSTCLSRQIGAVAVVDNHIVSTGYNGPASGFPHCQECARKGYKSGERLDLCKAVHAEQNVITQAARHGVSLFGSSVFCTNKPCNTCTFMLVNTGVEAVYFKHDYPNPDHFKYEDVGDCFYMPLVLRGYTLPTDAGCACQDLVFVCKTCGYHIAHKNSCPVCGGIMVKQ